MIDVSVDLQTVGVDLQVDTVESVIVVAGEQGLRGRDGAGANAVPVWYRRPAADNQLAYDLPAEGTIVQVVCTFNGVEVPVSVVGVRATLGMDAGDVASTDDLAFLIWS